MTVNGGSSSDIVAYYPPIITAAVDISTGTDSQIYNVSAGQQFTLYGWYFGIKAPKVYLEYEKNGKVAAAEPQGGQRLLHLSRREREGRQELHGRRHRQQHAGLDGPQGMAQGVERESRS